MSKTLDDTRRRFVEIDDLHERNRQDDNLWREWQSAGVDYWLLRHPELAPYRGRDQNRTLDGAEILELAELIRHGNDGIPRWWRIAPWDRARAERSAQVAWWHELMTALYAPTYRALHRVRRGDVSSIETLTSFLEADPVCHRSGYAKEEIIRWLTRLDLDASTRARLRAVLFAVIGKPTRREFRHYIRLARYLDEGQLRSDLASIAASGKRPDARHATWISVELERRGT